jgi:hypothetical protein
VTAIAPVPGRVLPRHWGAWRSAWSIGAGFAAAAVRLHGALLVRHPDRAAERDSELQALLRLERRW